MRTCVLDASVAAKWCLPEEWEDYSAQAVSLLGACVTGETKILVPDLFWAEMGSILWKAVRMRKLSSSSAFSSLKLIQNLGLFIHPTDDLISEALQIALQYHRTVYDCLYVALAVRSSTDFITADERLANALAAYFPVKWLGIF